MLSLVTLDGNRVLCLTDKQVAHRYLEEYDKLFLPFRDQPINLFEVGYWYGGSCELWRQYFPKAHIRAIDIERPRPKLRLVNGHHLVSNFVVPEGRVRLDLMSAHDLDEDYFKDFPVDIAIDDGSHELGDQLSFIITVFPFVKEGGMLIVEDIQDIDKTKKAFDGLDMPYEIFDKRGETNLTDSVFLLFRK